MNTLNKIAVAIQIGDIVRVVKQYEGMTHRRGAVGVVIRFEPATRKGGPDVIVLRVAEFEYYIYDASQLVVLTPATPPSQVAAYIDGVRAELAKQVEQADRAMALLASSAELVGGGHGERCEADYRVKRMQDDARAVRNAFEKISVTAQRAARSQTIEQAVDASIADLGSEVMQMARRASVGVMTLNDSQ